jgi:hypothetical protein
MLKGDMCPERSDFLALDDAGLLAQCQVHTYRASGPGGQKRNKTSSAVRLHHQPTGLLTRGTESRSQHENKARALRRLRMAIALHVRRLHDPRHDSPSPLLSECVTPDGRLQCGRRDHRYPRVVGELLDVLFAHEGRVSESADALGISTSHLTSFFRKDPKLWARVNDIRAHCGARPLR